MEQELEIQNMEEIYRKYSDGSVVVENFPEEGFCNCDYPLTDLPWLENFISTNHDFRISIELGTCKHGTCFSFYLSDDDGPYLLIYKNCKGETLGLIDSFIQNFFREYEVDYENKQLIYHINCYQ